MSETEEIREKRRQRFLQKKEAFPEYRQNEQEETTTTNIQQQEKQQNNSNISALERFKLLKEKDTEEAKILKLRTIISFILGLICSFLLLTSTIRRNSQINLFGIFLASEIILVSYSQKHLKKYSYQGILKTQINLKIYQLEQGTDDKLINFLPEKFNTLLNKLSGLLKLIDLIKNILDDIFVFIFGLIGAASLLITLENITGIKIDKIY